jgi:hypothetical protein
MVGAMHAGLKKSLEINLILATALPKVVPLSQVERSISHYQRNAVHNHHQPSLNAKVMLSRYLYHGVTFV